MKYNRCAEWVGQRVATLIAVNELERGWQRWVEWLLERLLELFCPCLVRISAYFHPVRFPIQVRPLRMIETGLGWG